MDKINQSDNFENPEVPDYELLELSFELLFDLEPNDKSSHVADDANDHSTYVTNYREF